MIFYEKNCYSKLSFVTVLRKKTKKSLLKVNFSNDFFK
jgi:hypothetical protein